MKSVISYTLNACQKCLKCLKVCPTEAITIIKERVHISRDKCINCGHCIEVCNTQGLQGKGSTLYDLSNYDTTIALIPSALYSCCKNKKEAAQLMEAIKEMGFSYVEEMSQIDGAIQKEIIQKVRQSSNRPIISSFCPVVNRLIRLRYPMLLEQMLDMDYPSEIAARKIRKKYQNHGKVGIFNFCECVSKLQIAQYPYGDEKSEIDHAISIGDHFPLINRFKDNSASEIEFCRKGLESSSMDSMALEPLRVLEAEGQNKITQVLELAEFGLLQQYDYINLAFCTNGCIGGRLLWGNPFEAQLNIKNLIKDAHLDEAILDKDDIGHHLQESIGNELTIQERLKLFAKINEVMEKLPHFDCGACGFASCRNMAENIALAKRSLEDCRILHKSEVKK